MQNCYKDLNLQIQIDALEKEVNQLQKEYDTTLVPYDDKKGKSFIVSLIVGAFFSITGGYLLFDSYSNFIFKIVGFVSLCIGIIFVVAAIKFLIQKDNPAERENNRKRIEPILIEKQSLLEELKKKKDGSKVPNIDKGK